MTMVTAIAGLALLGLGGCGTDDDPSGEPTTATTSTTSTVQPGPTSEPTTAAVADLAGDWHDVEAEWVMHFHDDGTFVEDFKGVIDFRVGKYAVTASTVSLIGDDGNTDEGKVVGDTLVFKLGTLTRK